jgi:MFS transporter, putative metabolite:H+ symporter
VLDRTDILSSGWIAARIERLPVSSWHTKVRFIVGTATMFDGFDTLAIAFVAPVLVPEWHLDPTEIGLLFSIGYVGQAIGAPLFGWMAERYGRIRSLNISILFLALAGLACALAQGYTSLIALRFLCGLGLGGEMPVGATYISEISHGRQRGRFVLLYQSIFPIGFLAAAIVSWLVVPSWGWRWIFVIGALPALLVIPLRLIMPESPRWLARSGQLDEADRVTSDIENKVSDGGKRVLPPIPTVYPHEVAKATSFRELFQGIYSRRTIVLWVMWGMMGGISYGNQIWIPTIVNKVYHVSLANTFGYSALGYLFLLAGCVVTALLIDRVGRRLIFNACFLADAVLTGILWTIALHSSGELVIALAMLIATVNGCAGLTFWVYAPESYPSRMRALGSGTASACARVFAMITPSAVGYILQHYDVSGVFALFFVMGVVALTASILAHEPSWKALEEVSP